MLMGRPSKSFFESISHPLHLPMEVREYNSKVCDFRTHLGGSPTALQLMAEQQALAKKYPEVEWYEA